MGQVGTEQMIILLDVQGIKVWGCGLDSSHSEQIPVTGFHESNNKPPSWVKR